MMELAGTLYGVMEQKVFSSHCIGADDIFCAVIRYGAPPVQQVVFHIGLLVFA